MTDTPNIDDALFPGIDEAALLTPQHKTHAPRILILYGSLRPRSFSRLSGEEAGRILTRLGADVRFFNPSGLPLVDDGVDATHPKVRELRDLVAWSEGMVWSSPERHGAMTGLMKTADRLDSAFRRCGASNPRQDTGGDAGLGRVPKLQRGQPDAHSGALDAADHHSQPVVYPEGVSGV
jgi:arsenical resistance protein ArsH